MQDNLPTNCGLHEGISEELWTMECGVCKVVYVNYCCVAVGRGRIDEHCRIWLASVR